MLQAQSAAAAVQQERQQRLQQASEVLVSTARCALYIEPTYSRIKPRTFTKTTTAPRVPYILLPPESPPLLPAPIAALAAAATATATSNANTCT